MNTHAQRGPIRRTRRQALALFVGGLLGLSWSRRARADDVEVPISVQIELLARVVKYDRNAAARMGAACKVLIVSREGDTASTRAATQARTELAKLDQIAGLPVAVSEYRWVDAPALLQRCADERAGIMLLTPGLSDEVAVIAAACVDEDLLSASLLGNDVAAGMVLGFTLESSRPTIVVNLRQARKQNVDFSARLLAIAKVIE
jgi:hypothetical protein